MTEIQTLHDVELELQRRETEDPLGLIYKPHEKQIECHRSRKPLTIVLGGNRVGKTWYAVAESLYHATGRSTWAQVTKPPATIWYVMPSLTMFRRTVLPVLRKLAPRDAIRLTQTGDIITKHDHVVRFKNGSEIHFVSADMRQRRLQGAKIDLVIMDETPDETVFEELQARVFDNKGRIILVFSPIDAKTYWVRDKLYIPWNAGDRLDIDFIMMPIADRQGNPLVPFYTREDIERAERQWPDPSVRAARMYGEFITRTGIVYRSFDTDVHLVRPFKIPDEYARWFVCDPQYHRFATLFFAADDIGHYYITDELFSQDDNLASRAERLMVIAGPRDRAIPVYVDSANPQDAAELNWHFQRLGAPLAAVPLPMKKQVDKMVLRAHALLEPDDDRKYPSILGLGDDKNPIYGAPRLFFFDTLCSTWRWQERQMQCSRLIWEIQRLSWGATGKPDKTSADGADCCDALVYGCAIVAAGVRLPEQEMWTRNLRPEDILIWRAIERHDNRQQFLNRD